jgi:hypothetical protein
VERERWRERAGERGREGLRVDERAKEIGIGERLKVERGAIYKKRSKEGGQLLEKESEK